MDEDLEIDWRLFGVTADGRRYDGLVRAVDDPFEGEPVQVLDIKATPADPFLDMQAMLIEMTKELRERFQRFQSQKAHAEADAAATADDTARKLAQTDAKAAIEAVSLIVRTLEKIDSLQRILIAERLEAEEAQAGSEDAVALKAEFERLVEERVKERLDARIKAWIRQGEHADGRPEGDDRGPDAGAGGGGGDGDGP
ncbi:hypothetical protein KYK29_19085 [Shinella daejeonensis]|uniref:hypothetical protein n=1 Tax=Shinella daejeonensis TaxID=659017 RepID=UPI0020C79142|nr:hypothetical protein [Shinella daejeonensis]MCP8897037.1 hypothetical protein [Shinella daejeonensis]